MLNLSHPLWRRKGQRVDKIQRVYLHVNMNMLSKYKTSGVQVHPLGGVNVFSKFHGDLRDFNISCVRAESTCAQLLNPCIFKVRRSEIQRKNTDEGKCNNPTFILISNFKAVSDKIYSSEPVLDRHTNQLHNPPLCSRRTLHHKSKGQSETERHPLTTNWHAVELPCLTSDASLWSLVRFFINKSWHVETLKEYCWGRKHTRSVLQCAVWLLRSRRLNLAERCVIDHCCCQFNSDQLRYWSCVYTWVHIRWVCVLPTAE